MGKPSQKTRANRDKVHSSIHVHSFIHTGRNVKDGINIHVQGHIYHTLAAYNYHDAHMKTDDVHNSINYVQLIKLNK